MFALGASLALVVLIIHECIIAGAYETQSHFTCHTDLMKLPSEINGKKPVIHINIKGGAYCPNTDSDFANVNATYNNRHSWSYATRRISVPLRYHYTPGIGYHSYYDRKVSWNEARKICMHEGGHLAVVDSVEERDALRRVYEMQKHEMPNLFHELSWIGFHDLYEEGDYTTIFNTPLTKIYHRWSPTWRRDHTNEHNKERVRENHSHGADCGAFLNKEGELADVACQTDLPFYCEIPS